MQRILTVLILLVLVGGLAGFMLLQGYLQYAPMTTAPPNGGDSSQPDPRAIDLQTTVTQPWQSLLGLDKGVQDRFGTRAELIDALNDADASAGETTKALNEYDEFQQQTADQILGTSFYILLDFADFLQRYLPNVWAELPTGSGAGLEAGELALLNRLKMAVANSQPLAQALKNIVNYRQQLDDAVQPYPSSNTNWPPAFSLADPDVTARRPADSLAHHGPRLQPSSLRLRPDYDR